MVQGVVGMPMPRRIRALRLLPVLALLACLIPPLQVFAQQPAANVARAGEVYALRGSSIVNNQFIPAPGSGEEGKWMYLIDPQGLRHPIMLTPTSSRTLFARPYAESPIDSLRELVGICPVPSATAPTATAQAGSFYIRDNMLWVDHSGFAFQINVRFVSQDALNAFGDAPAIENALTVMPELRTTNCVPRGAGTGADAPQAPACPNPLAGMIPGRYAGQIVALRGSSIVMGTYRQSPTPGVGTIDDTLYIVDRLGQRRPLITTRTTGPVPPPPDAREEVYSAFEVYGLCPTPGPTTRFEGSFFLEGTMAYVVRNGYAYPIFVRFLSMNELEGIPEAAGEITSLTELVAAR